jgi:hypothetical protein
MRVERQLLVCTQMHRCGDGDVSQGDFVPAKPALIRETLIKNIRQFVPIRRFLFDRCAVRLALQHRLDQGGEIYVAAGKPVCRLPQVPAVDVGAHFRFVWIVGDGLVLIGHVLPFIAQPL